MTMRWPAAAPDELLPLVAYHCRCRDGERVTVLVKNSEPHLEYASADRSLLRVVGADGQVIVDDVEDIAFSRKR